MRICANPVFFFKKKKKHGKENFEHGNVHGKLSLCVGRLVQEGSGNARATLRTEERTGHWDLKAVVFGHGCGRVANWDSEGTTLGRRPQNRATKKGRGTLKAKGGTGLVSVLRPVLAGCAGSCVRSCVPGPFRRPVLAPGFCVVLFRGLEVVEKFEGHTAFSRYTQGRCGRHGMGATLLLVRNWRTTCDQPRDCSSLGSHAQLQLWRRAHFSL